MKKWLKRGLLVLLAVAAIAAWQFFHPALPPLREPFTTVQAPIDDRVGVYASKPDGAEYIIVPALTSGYYKMTVDHWGAQSKISAEQLSAEPLDRLPEQPYSIRELKVTPSVTLAGWLFEPAGEPRTGLVILHGSGDSNRSNGWYVFLAHTLASAGHVVLLPDKRGSGRSEGDWRGESLHTLAADGAAWVAELRAQRPDLQDIGVIGVSQGGMIAPEVADLSNADFVAALSASVVSLSQQLRLEVGNDIARAGPPGWLQPFLGWAYTIRAKNRFAEFWAKNTDYDFLAGWEKWRGPMYLALGERDEQLFVPVRASVRRLQSRYDNRGPLQWRVYDGVRHCICYESGPREGRFHPQHLADLLRWISDRRLETPTPDPMP